MKILKKKIFKSSVFVLVATTLLATGFLFAGCKRKDYGNFTQDEIVVSVGDYIDFYDYYQYKDVEDITFESQDKAILDYNEDTWTALSSGSTVVYAYGDGKQVDYINIFVKSAFGKPSNISLDDQGNISWNKSFVVQEGLSVEAQYEIKIDRVDIEQPTIKETLNTNFYKLEKYGIYDVNVRAVGTERIDGTDFYNYPTRVYYNAMRPVTNLTFTPNEYGEASGTLSWVNQEENSSIKILMNGVVYSSFTNETSINISTGSVSSDRDMTFEIVTLDLLEQKIESSTKLTVKKLQTPQIRFEGEKLVWNGVQNASKYRVYTSEEDYFTNETSFDFSTMSSGTFTFGVQAVGGLNTINSNGKILEKQVKKLGNGRMTAEVDGEYVKFTLSSKDYDVTDYKVYRDDEEVEVAWENVTENEGQYIRVGKSLLSDKGEISFSYRSVPNGESRDYYCVSSNVTTGIKAYSLEKTTNVSHNVNSSGESILTFSEVEFANLYKIKIKGFNGSWVDLSEVESNALEVNIGTLDTENYSKFSIVVVSSRENAEGEVVFERESDEKILTVLENPQMQELNGSILGKVEEETNCYSWTIVENAEYEYILTKTNSSFEDQEVVSQDVISQNTIETSFGYYKLQVKAVSTDKNNYLDAPNYVEDEFYVSKQIDAPSIVVKYGDINGDSVGEYYLEMSKVDNSVEYEIAGFGRATVGSNDNVKFILGNLDEVRVYNISAIAVGSDSLINTNSEKSNEIKVTRLAKPTIDRVDQNENVFFTIPEGGTSLEFSTGETVQDSVDVSSTESEKRISLYALGIKTTDERLTTEGYSDEVCLMSGTAEFTFRRTTPPSELSFESNKLSLTHSANAEDYTIYATVSHINGVSNVEYKTSTKSVNISDIYPEVNNISSVKFTVKANINKNVNGVWYLTSQHSEEITVGKLNRITDLTYNISTKQLAWSSLGENVTYKLYKNLDSEPFVETNQTSYVITEVINENTSIYIIATGLNTINSSKSNEIVLRPVGELGELLLSYKNDGANGTVGTYVGEINASQLIRDNISEIKINDISNSIEDNKLKIEEISGNVNVQIIPKNSDVNGDKTNYYIGLNRTYSLSQLTCGEGTVTIGNENVVMGVEDKDANAVYEIEIWQGENFKKSLISGSSELMLNDEFFTSLEEGNYSIKVNLIANNQSVQSVGVYGKVSEIAVGSIEKLGTLTINTTWTNGETIDIETANKLDISFSKLKTDVSFKYDVYVNNSFVQSFTTETFELSQDIFVEGSNTIKIITTGNGYIPSVSEKTAEKFVKPVVEISDEGKLTFESEGKFLIEYRNKSSLLLREELDITTGDIVTSLREKIDAITGITGEVIINIVKLGKTTSESSVNTAYLPSDVCELSKQVLVTPNRLTISEQGIKINISSSEGAYEGEVEFTVVSAKLGESDVARPTVSGNSFNLPDTWVGGLYTLQIQAKQVGKITSKTSEVTLDVDRLNTPEITLERGVNLTDIVISWESIENSAHYILDILKDQEKIVPSIQTTSTSYSISDIEIPVGEITIELTAVGESSGSIANSIKATKVVEKLNNTISNLEANEKGYLAWEDSVEANSYILTNETFETSNEITEKVYEPSLSSGDYKFNIRIKGDLNSTIDSDSITYEGEVPQQISLVIAGAEGNLSTHTGKITFNVGVGEGTQEDFKLFAKYNSQIFDLSNLEREVESTQISLYIADVIETIGVTENGGTNLKLTLYTTIGELKSKDTEKIIPAWDKQSTISLKEKTGYDDYLSFVNGSGETIESLQVRIKKILNGSVESIKYYNVEVKNNGPITSLEETKISDILDDVGLTDVGIYKISVSGTSGANDSDYTQLCWTEEVDINRLASVSEFKNISGLLSWQNVNQAPIQATNFKLIFTDTNGSVIEIIKSADELSLTEGDLSNLQTNQDYKVVIYSLSTEKGCISSYKCAFSQDSVVRRANPNTELTLENGELFLEWGTLTSLSNETMSEMFNKANNLLQVLDWYRVKKSNNVSIDNSNFASQLINKHFSSPISFKFNSLNKTNILIKFSNGSVEKELTQSAIYLLRNLKDVVRSNGESYYSILNEIYNNTGNTTIGNFIGWLNSDKYFTGVANKKIVFDDIGSYGAEDIDKGDYKISIKQLQGEEGNYRVLRSDYVEKITSATVVEAPSLSAHSKDVSVDIASTINKYTRYYLDFKPLEGFTNYTLVLYNSNTRLVFNIVNVSDEQWQISLEGDSRVVELITYGEYISIPLNSREDQSGIDLLDNSIYGHDYKATLFANANGENKLNSKSDYYEISFRNFDLSDFKVRQGEFSWSGYSQVYVLLHNDTVSYKSTIRSNRKFDISELVDSSSYLTWNWIQFNIKGGINTANLQIYVDSPLYKVENVKSSPIPTVSVANGNILIEDVEKGAERQYRISNNVSGSLYYLTNQEGSSYSYQPGTNFYSLNNDNKNYKDTEVNASKFYIYNIGTKEATFTTGEFNNGTYVMTPSETIYLRSKEATLTKSMLKAPSNIKINDEGKLTWESEYSEGVKYQLKIVGYRKTKDGGGNDVYTAYSSKEIENTASLKEIDLVKELDDQIDYYSFEIRIISNESTALGSEVSYFGTNKNPISRAKEVENLTAFGTIKWKDSENSNFKVYSSGEILEGTKSVKNNEYSFVPSLLVGGTSYSLGVRSFKEGFLPSKLTQFKNGVYKLPDMSEEDIYVTEIGDEYLVSFEKYAKKINMYGGAKDYYSILVNGVEKNVYSIKKSDISSGEVEITIQATYTGSAYLIIASNEFIKTFQQADSSQIGVIKWENSSFTWGRSEGVTYDVEITTKYGVYTETRKYEGLSENQFSPTLMGEITSFKVRLRNGTSDIPSAYVEFKVEEGESIPEVNTFAGGDGTKNNPYLVGSVDQFKNISTKLAKPESSSSYYRILIENESTVRYDGIYNDPDEVYYFKQTADITLGTIDERLFGSIISGEFGGVYDGGKYNINIYAKSSDIASTEVYLYNLDRGTTKTTYSKGFALFENISSKGIIKNIKLTIDYKETEKGSLACGICLINKGRIENSVVQDITLSDIVDTTFAGFVGMNKGTICNTGSVANYSLTFSSPEAKKNINFKFAGVCVDNHGEMIKCYNEKDINFTISKAESVRVAGVVLSNFKSMRFCYNSGNLKSNTNGNDYVFGIVEYNNGSASQRALLSYCYNSGDIVGDTVGGLAGYFGSNSKISNAVLLGSVNNSTTDAKLLAYNYTSPKTGWSEDVYVPTNYDTQSNLNIVDITAITKTEEINSIVYTLTVTRNLDEYFVVIS